MPPIGEIHPKAEYVLGVDLARLGEDESVFIVVEKPFDDDKLYVVWIGATKHKLLTDAIGRVVWLDSRFHFKMVYLDETGLGSGPTDVLKEKLGYRIRGVTFTTKSKQEIYNNLKSLLEIGRLKLPKHKKLLFQLMDLRYELMSTGDFKIHHSDRGHDDYADALALACLHFQPIPKRSGYYIA